MPALVELPKFLFFLNFAQVTPTIRLWSIRFHITVVQILTIILGIVLKKIMQHVLFSSVYPLAKTYGFLYRP